MEVANHSSPGGTLSFGLLPPSAIRCCFSLQTHTHFAVAQHATEAAAVLPPGAALWVIPKCCWQRFCFWRTGRKSAEKRAAWRLSRVLLKWLRGLICVVVCRGSGLIPHDLLANFQPFLYQTRFEHNAAVTVGHVLFNFPGKIRESL